MAYRSIYVPSGERNETDSKCGRRKIIGFRQKSPFNVN